MYVARDGYGLGRIADVGELEFLRPFRHGNRVVSVEIRDGSHGSSRHKYTHTDKRFVGVVDHFSGNRPAARLCESGKRADLPEDADKQKCFGSGQIS